MNRARPMAARLIRSKNYTICGWFILSNPREQPPRYVLMCVRDKTVLEVGVEPVYVARLVCGMQGQEHFEGLE